MVRLHEFNTVRWLLGLLLFGMGTQAQGQASRSELRQLFAQTLRIESGQARQLFELPASARKARLDSMFLPNEQGLKRYQAILFEVSAGAASAQGSEPVFMPMPQLSQGRREGPIYWLLDEARKRDKGLVLIGWMRHYPISNTRHPSLMARYIEQFAGFLYNNSPSYTLNFLLLQNPLRPINALEDGSFWFQSLKPVPGRLGGLMPRVLLPASPMGWGSFTDSLQSLPALVPFSADSALALTQSAQGWLRAVPRPEPAIFRSQVRLDFTNVQRYYQPLAWRDSGGSWVGELDPESPGQMALLQEMNLSTTLEGPYADTNRFDWQSRYRLSELQGSRHTVSARLFLPLPKGYIGLRVKDRVLRLFADGRWEMDYQGQRYQGSSTFSNGSYFTLSIDTDGDKARLLLDGRELGGPKPVKAIPKRYSAQEPELAVLCGQNRALFQYVEVKRPLLPGGAPQGKKPKKP